MPDQKHTSTRPALLARARKLRREMTPQERALWRRLRRKQLYGIKFRRQHPMGAFILDFFCNKHRLAIEIDGHSHYEPAQQARDLARTTWLHQRGIRVIRFTNREVDVHLDSVLAEIARQCGIREPPSNSPHGGGRT
jgi:very-short-patch-repair endonuclease